MPAGRLTACKNESAPANGNDAGSADHRHDRPETRSVVEITGAGATFIYPLLSKWSDDYNKSTGAKINYQSIGSGGGIAQIKAGTVDFGSSDKPLPPEELAQAGLAQFPSAVGGVVPVVNVEGIETGKLRLTGALLADIFLGKVATWNDPAIAALNPGLPLPSAKINVVHRSDGSGTTFNFVNYLSKVSPEWNSKVGEGTSVNWPGGVGGKGNEGVAAYVKQIKGAIGYVELAYATENGMAYASDAERRRQLGAADGGSRSPQPPPARTGRLPRISAWSSPMHRARTPGRSPPPISSWSTSTPKDAQRTRNTLDFFKWAFENGQTQADALHFVPLPAELVQQIEAYWASDIKA